MDGKALGDAIVDPLTTRPRRTTTVFLLYCELSSPWPELSRSGTDRSGWRASMRTSIVANAMIDGTRISDLDATGYYEMRVFFKELLERIDGIALDGPAPLTQTNFVQGLKQLSIRYSTKQRLPLPP